MSSSSRLPTLDEAVSGARRLVEVLRPHWSLLLILVLGGGVFAAMVSASAEVYDNVQDSDELAALDQPALQEAVALRSPGLDRVVTAYTDLGGPVWAPVVVSVVVVVLALLWRSWVPPVLMVLAVAGSLAMTSAGKVVVARDRPPREFAVPPYETSAAFPSGHTLNATVIAGVLAYLVILHVRSRLWSVVAVATAVLYALSMGASRVYLGHHWLTDVMVAWALGLAWLALVLSVHQLLLRRVRHRGRTAETVTVAP